MADQPHYIITFTTDFGLKDHYVASLKAAVLEVNPDVTMVDLTHQIPPHDLLEAGFALRCAYSDFPTRTIHVCVVDPGVGTARRPIVVATDDQYFVGPDNGVFSFIYEAEYISRVHTITEEHYMRRSVSSTFHGRDVFAPAAAFITRGVDIANFGEQIDDYRKIDVPKPKRPSENVIKGLILHVDRFGNLITCIHSRHIEKVREAIGGEGKFRVKVGSHTIDGVQRTYADGQEGPIALIGSSGFLEIAVPRKGAAKALEVKRGEAVELAIG